MSIDPCDHCNFIKCIIGFVCKNAKIRIFRSVYLHSVSAQLVQDMKVQWDSLYFMINQFPKLRPVCLNSIILKVNTYKNRPSSIFFLCPSIENLRNLDLLTWNGLYCRILRSYWVYVSNIETYSKLSLSLRYPIKYRH